MAKQCDLCGKGTVHGQQVSHAHNVTKRTWEPNLKWKRLYDPESKRWVRLKVSTRVLRTIDRKGLAATLRDSGIRIEDL